MTLFITEIDDIVRYEARLDSKGWHIKTTGWMEAWDVMDMLSQAEIPELEKGYVFVRKGSMWASE